MAPHSAPPGSLEFELARETPAADLRNALQILSLLETLDAEAAALLAPGLHSSLDVARADATAAIRRRVTAALHSIENDPRLTISPQLVEGMRAGAITAAEQTGIPLPADWLGRTVRAATLAAEELIQRSATPEFAAAMAHVVELSAARMLVARSDGPLPDDNRVLAISELRQLDALVQRCDCRPDDPECPLAMVHRKIKNAVELLGG